MCSVDPLGLEPLAGDETVRGHRPKGAPVYFQILAASGGGYFVRIRGGNNETMFHSEVYSTVTAARNAINVVKANAATAPVYE